MIEVGSEILASDILALGGGSSGNGWGMREDGSSENYVRFIMNTPIFDISASDVINTDTALGFGTYFLLASPTTTVTWNLQAKSNGSVQDYYAVKGPVILIAYMSSLSASVYVMTINIYSLNGGTLTYLGNFTKQRNDNTSFTVTCDRTVEVIKI